MTNSSQAVTASLTLSAFGQTIASSGSSTSAYGFGATSGYRSDGDAGLTLVGCRYYDAQVGRFITRDTYLDQAPYAYCDGDPVNATDPTGHILWLLVAVVLFFVAETDITEPVTTPLPNPTPIRGSPGPTYSKNDPVIPPRPVEARTSRTMVELREQPGEGGGQGGGFGGARGFGDGDGGMPEFPIRPVIEPFP